MLLQEKRKYGDAKSDVLLDDDAASEGKSGLKDKDMEEGGTKTESDVVGTHFWEMLTVLLDLLWQPEQMHEKLIIMTKKFYELGIRQV